MRNAAGVVALQSFVIFKAKHLAVNWCVDGPKNNEYTTSPSDWMEENALVLDGHSTHVRYQVALLCIKNNFKLICPAAHSLHILQPLDVRAYCHAKKVWRQILDEYYTNSLCSNLTKNAFVLLQSKLFNSVVSSSNYFGVLYYLRHKQS